MKKAAIFILIILLVSSAFAGDVTITLVGVNPLTINVKGNSSNEEAGGISVYLYFRDDGTTDLITDNVSGAQLETAWGWGTGFLTKTISTGSWSKGGHTFTRRLLYDNVGNNSLDDYWSTDGINAIICTFTTVGSGHVYIEANGVDALADWSSTSHTVSYANQDHSLPVTLSLFSAELIDGGVKISWATESETDNIGFILERSDHRTGLWETVATYQTEQALRGQGNTSERTDYQYVDLLVEFGMAITYRLSDVSSTGQVNVYDLIQIELPDRPRETAIGQAFPNPFNPTTNFSYQLAEAADVTVSIVNILGQTVRVLVSEPKGIGSFKHYWDGCDDSNNHVPSGVYFLVLNTGKIVKTQKLILTR
ncbi:T9SS type A sorting domain-containing protein [bacterium]|nr:T9SS type A sorting domain-containing protein [bacterium]